ncbi:hypothetical protein [Methanocorpusculum labreanum]|uniref:hypothetical protein n=1 Tax=Methanocorpusculum labreanum TaxID=83984 RepID=UPI00164FFF7B|nr:hypothetical protein [Methanocorpusculum labreanum]
MLWEKPACGFFCCLIIFSITQKERLTERKTGTPVFPTAFVQEPEALETSHELLARGLFQPACDSCVGEAHLGLFAVKLIHVSTPSRILPKLDREHIA